MFQTNQVTNASNTQPKALSPTSLRVSWCTIQGLITNTGKIAVSGQISSQPAGYTISNPGDSFVIWSPASLHVAIDLAEVFILPTVANEGVGISYVK